MESFLSYFDFDFHAPLKLIITIHRYVKKYPKPGTKGFIKLLDVAKVGHKFSFDTQSVYAPKDSFAYLLMLRVLANLEKTAPSHFLPF